MNNKLITLFLLLTLGLTTISATEYINYRKPLYNFVLNYGGTEEDMHKGLAYMCDNAEFSPYLLDYWNSKNISVEILGYYTTNWTYQGEEWITSTCRYKKTYTQWSDYYGKYTTYSSYSSIWYLDYRDTDEGRIVKMWGYTPGGVNTKLTASLPLLE